MKHHTKKDKDFFWLDETECEGVEHEEADTRNVGQFLKDRDYQKRLDHWGWFVDLKTTFAHRQFDKQFKDTKSLQQFYEVIRIIWFDFDSVPLDPKTRDGLQRMIMEAKHNPETGANKAEAEWEVIQKFITNCTHEFCYNAKKKLDFSLPEKDFQDHFQEFLMDIPKRGLL